MRVVICGAGVIGAAIAYYLSLRGVGATLVERNDVACAASGKSGGFLALDWCDGSAQAALARTSFALHADLARTLPADYGYRRVRTLLVASSDAHEPPAHARGQAPHWLDGACAVRGEIGSESTTAQLHPRLFTRALVDAALARGARLVHGVVDGLALDASGARARGVSVAGDLIEADAVVVAMGPWSQAFAGSLALPQVGGLKGYSITLRPRAPVGADALFVDYEAADGSDPSPEVVPRADGEVYLCGLSGDEPLPADPADVLVDDDKCAALARIAGRLSSALAGADVTARQACYRPICADALPVIGASPAVAGVYVATGHNCWGMLNAPATGLAMSELLLDGAAGSVDLEPFRAQRF